MHPNKSKGARPKNWIDFRELRKRLNFKQVLTAYGVELQQEEGGDQQQTICPLPGHKGKGGNTFSVNLTKGIFHCFGCNAGGNVIDFAVLMEGGSKNAGEKVRAVALELQKRFLEDKEQSKVAEDNQKRIVNVPLDFELKTIDPSHLYFAEHKLTLETVAHFGLGYCNRGKLKGRIAVPIHDDNAQLIGYSGLIVDERQVTPEKPQYIFPAEREVDGITHVFDRGKVLYNAHRITKAAKHLFVVTHCHLAWWLWQSGLKNVIALMGDTCSAEQRESIGLLKADNGCVWLMFDKNSNDTSFQQNLLTRIAENYFCRWHQFTLGEPVLGFGLAL